MRRPPAPLTPLDADVSRLEWFPLHHAKLLRSSFWLRSSDQVCRVSVELWCEAWTQVPAASLPNEDVVLARIVKLTLKEWLAIRNEVLAAWTLCRDGRYYHPLLAAVAIERMALREGWKDRKRRQREKDLPDPGDPNMSRVSSRGTTTGTARGRLPSPSHSESFHRDSVQERELTSQDRARGAKALTVVEGGKP